MANSISTKPSLDRIDTKMFFDLLADRIDVEQFSLVTAAMAESIGHGGVARVLNYATSPRTRITKLRKQLKDKIKPVDKA